MFPFSISYIELFCESYVYRHLYSEKFQASISFSHEIEVFYLNVIEFLKHSRKEIQQLKNERSARQERSTEIQGALLIQQT